MSTPINVERQAVVIVHGIGEQRPMDTVKSFVEAIKKIDTTDSPLQPVWLKPDKISEGFEHRRFTIPGHRNRPVTDVYELYWAHLFEQESHRTFFSWFAHLVFRRSKALPLRFRRLQFLVRVVLAMAATVLTYSFWGTPNNFLESTPIILVFVSGFIFYWISYWMLNHLADAARYLDASPRNIVSRNEVRKLGVDFLRNLHQSDRGYNRIVLCGHSLGSIIGLDILNHFWYERHSFFEKKSRYNQEVLQKFHEAIESGNFQNFRNKQRELFRELAAVGLNWSITDFVTMGSPLAHSDAILAKSADQFILEKEQGITSTCPPTPDRKDKKIWHKHHFNLDSSKVRTIKILNSNSVFAPVRWTNIYLQRNGIALGDPVSGPLKPLYGWGVRDLPVKLPVSSGWFQHSLYWSVDKKGNDNPALEALRKALMLDHRQY
ncbi:hypothetical protein [Ruegeria sp. HKCCA4633]|uniref:hypothetical protein n=1 Tax=Ruegeria sp. HKCCA4633 TaxID=2682983 RepID=UPI0014886A0D|nr:hypothetical protein [Ruegeria sp. HKCCA4633]